MIPLVRTHLRRAWVLLALLLHLVVDRATSAVERGRLSEARRESEEQLRIMADAIPQLAWMARPDGYIIWYNRRWYEYTGTTPEQMEGWGWRSVHDPAVLPQVLQRWMASIDTRQPFEMDFPLRGADGQYRWFLTRVIPIRDANGHVVRWFGTNTDITEHKLTEEALRQQTEELQTLMETPPVAVWVSHDPECRYIVGNRMANTLYEARESENVSANPPPGEPVRPRRFFAQGRELSARELPMQVAAAQNREVRNSELEVILPSGRRIFLLGSAWPLRDAEGRVRGALGAFLDITERKQAETEREQLLADVRRVNDELAVASAEANRRAAELDAIIESTTEGISVVDPVGRIVRMNQAGLRILGLDSFQELRGRFDTYQALPFRSPNGELMPLEKRPLYRALHGETVQAQEVIVTAEDGGERILLIGAAAVRDAQGHVLFATDILRDITAMRRLEEQREDFVRMVSHDLRSPLTAVRGYAQMLALKLGKLGMDDLARQAQAIITSSRRMDSMITDLVETARLETGRGALHKQEVDLFALVRETIEHLGTPEDRARIQVQAEKTVSPVEVDVERLERAVTNLLTNALKYSAADRPVSVYVRRHAGQALVQVADQGVGIPPEDIPHLFERFYRARTAGTREGLGLGLYITCLIVQAHGGSITVESEAGKGSTFTIALPETGHVRDH